MQQLAGTKRTSSKHFAICWLAASKNAKKAIATQTGFDIDRSSSKTIWPIIMIVGRVSRTHMDARKESFFNSKLCAAFFFFFFAFSDFVFHLKKNWTRIKKKTGSKVLNVSIIAKVHVRYVFAHCFYASLITTELINSGAMRKKWVMNEKFKQFAHQIVSLTSFQFRRMNEKKMEEEKKIARVNHMRCVQ